MRALRGTMMAIDFSYLSVAWCGWWRKSDIERHLCSAIHHHNACPAVLLVLLVMLRVIQVKMTMPFTVADGSGVCWQSVRLTPNLT
jgi:hypothetical protein